MSVLVGKKAPVFWAPAVVNGSEIEENFSLNRYVGKNMWFSSSILPISLLYVPQKLLHFKKK
jgi:hypothetical protein